MKILNLIILGCMMLFISCSDDTKTTDIVDDEQQDFTEIKEEDLGNDAGSIVENETHDKSVIDEKFHDEDTVIDNPVQSEWDENDFTTIYNVGPGFEYADPSEVPWESLMPSTLVKIHYRDEPYRDKWVISVAATSNDPVVILGVPQDGKIPVISGDNAKTRRELDYWNENRSIIKVGGSSKPDENIMPSNIYIENLDIQNGRPAYNFTDDGGSNDTYSRNAACIHMEKGDNITVRGCKLHSCGNGLFIGSSTKNVRIAGNHIYDNGIEGRFYEHNTYTEAQGIIYEYNYFGPLRDGCDGNNLKDRSSGTIIRYNWIEAGNRQLDLVETGHDHILNDPAYDETFVYGNILIEPQGAGNSQIIHYGGDGNDGLGEAYYRKGTLYFYHNTVVSTRSGNTTLIRLSTNDVTADIRNNIIYSAGNLAITNGQGIVNLHSNWLKENWRDTFESSFVGVMDETGNVEGSNPGFINSSGNDFRLSTASTCVDLSETLPTQADNYPVLHQYEKHQQIVERVITGQADAGAFESEE